MNYHLIKRISYFFEARHSKGHGIHSPFLFRLITQVVENDGYFSAYPLLKAAGENVLNMLRILDVEHFKQKECGKNELKRCHRLPSRYDRLLLRLVSDFRPREIAFYGNTFGVTLLALALADSRINVEAQVENDHFRSFCRRLAEIYEVGNITITETGKTGPADFVVIQNPLDPERCYRILKAIFSPPDFQGIVVVCGIHTSHAMESVWAGYKSNPAVRVSLDMFEIGLFICQEALQKEEFVLRF